jgi:hypothetical protein
MTLAGPVRASSPDVEIRAKELLVDGRPFRVKGIHYGPWRPGTGPNKGYPYPSREAVDQDLALIEGLHANTILVFDPPDEVLDLAERHHLKVLYNFSLDWWSVGGPEHERLQNAVIERVKAARKKPALLAWVLGNEIPSSAVIQRGERPIIEGLADLYRAVKRADPRHPVTHANWPPMKALDLKFLDFISFNVYPLWPPEVVAAGFGPYLRDVLQPIAGGKPLLITEFGVNTIEAGEAGQARLLKECWEGIGTAQSVGGVVFEFADEWWKNYNNPRRPGDWWDREPAPNDEKRHDLDPEEYYGIVTAERHPRPAFGVVRDLFADEQTRGNRVVPAGIIAILVISATAAWLYARHRRGEAPLRPNPAPPPRVS